MELEQLEKASLTVQGQNAQKVWKRLSELYEESQSWLKHANALIQLYNIVKDKRNYERANQLAEIILSSYLKNDNFSSIKEFGLNHLQLLELSDQSSKCDHVISIIDFLLRNPSDKKIKPIEFSFEESSTIFDALFQKVCLKADKSDSFTKHLPNNLQNFLISHAIALRNGCVASSLSAETNPSSTHICTHLPLHFRLLLYFLEASDTELEINIIEVLTDLVAESFLLSSSNNFIIDTDKVYSLMSIVVKKYPGIVAAPTTLAMRYISYGCLEASRVYIDLCTQYWLSFRTTNSVVESSTTFSSISARSLWWSNPKFPKSNVSISLTIEHSLESSIVGLCMNAIVTAAIWDGFRGLSVADCSHITAEARRKDAWSRKYFGTCQMNMSSLVQLAAIKAQQYVKGRKKIIVDSFKYLTHYFNVDHNSVVLKSDYLLSLWEHASEPMNICEMLPITWACVRIANDLGLYRQVIDFSEKWLQSHGVLHSLPSSWVLLELSHANLMVGVEDYYSKIDFQNCVQLPPRNRLRDIVLEEGITTACIRTLQQGLKLVDSQSIDSAGEIKLRIGIAMWLNGGKLREDKNGCISFLMQGAKSDPSHSQAFTFIGHYYANIIGDKHRAIKCYQKSIQLDPLNEEAGYSISEIYLEMGYIAAAVSLWDEVASRTYCAFWCSYIRGRFLSQQGREDDAVRYFHEAIDLNDNEASLYFDLGLAYTALYQNLAAQKALRKARILAPQDMNVMFSLGVVEKRLCLLEDSRSCFQMVITSQPNHILAKVELADLYLLFAYESLSFGWTVEAARNIRDGIKYIEQAIASSSELADTATSWKLFGDLCSFTYNVSPWELSSISNASNYYSAVSALTCDSEAPSGFGSFGNFSEWASNNELLQLLSKGEYAYRRVVEIIDKITTQGNLTVKELKVCQENLAAAWHDCGSVCYNKARVILYCQGQGSGLLATSLYTAENSITYNLLNTAKLAFTQSIRINPSYSEAWNGLGLCMQSDKIRYQLCISRATQLEACPAAYSNLGLRLLIEREDDAALECFSALQSLENNSITWTSLGALFERKGSSLDLSFLTKANDAYEAALEVAKPLDALLGAAITWLQLNHWMNLSNSSLPCIQSKISVTELANVRHKVECRLICYLRRQPCHPTAWAMLAWCLELRKSYISAYQCWLKVLGALNLILPVVASTNFDIGNYELFERSRVVRKKEIASLVQTSLLGMHRSTTFRNLNDGEFVLLSSLYSLMPSPSITTFYSSLPYLSALIPYTSIKDYFSSCTGADFYISKIGSQYAIFRAEFNLKCILDFCVKQDFKNAVENIQTRFIEQLSDVSTDSTSLLIELIELANWIKLLPAHQVSEELKSAVVLTLACKDAAQNNFNVMFRHDKNSDELELDMSNTPGICKGIIYHCRLQVYVLITIAERMMESKYTLESTLLLRWGVQSHPFCLKLWLLLADCSCELALKVHSIHQVRTIGYRIISRSLADEVNSVGISSDEIPPLLIETNQLSPYKYYEESHQSLLVHVAWIEWQWTEKLLSTERDEVFKLYNNLVQQHRREISHRNLRHSKVVRTKFDTGDEDEELEMKNIIETGEDAVAGNLHFEGPEVVTNLVHSTDNFSIAVTENRTPSLNELLRALHMDPLHMHIWAAIL